MSTPPVQFDFGQNWKEFSKSALTPERVAQSKNEFIELLGTNDLSGKRFLDLGFGQGLGLLNAGSLGARTFGCDINPKCAQVVATNFGYYPSLSEKPWIVVGSILDSLVVNQLRSQAPEGYDIVHSWGVLHHTGNMDLAVCHAASLVQPGGKFVLAIYNRHWSSRAWWIIKRTYVAAPKNFQRALIGLFYPIIYCAKWIVTRKSPKRQERGMDFYYDVIDWVGGYPYEYATINQMRGFVEALGFETIKICPSRVPTGCNEFVFRRKNFIEST